MLKLEIILSEDFTKYAHTWMQRRLVSGMNINWASLKIVLSFLSLKNMLSFACSYGKKLSLQAITSFRDSARKLIYAVIPPISMIRAIFLIWFLYSKSMNIFNPIYIACQQKET